MLPERRQPERITSASLEEYPWVDSCRRCVIQTECGKVFSGIVSLVGQESDYKKYLVDGDVEDLYDPNTEATSGEDLSDK